MDTVSVKAEKMEERCYRHEELSIPTAKWRINMFTQHYGCALSTTYRALMSSGQTISRK